MIEIANLHEQYLSIKEEIDSAIADVISRSAFVGSKAVAKFEESRLRRSSFAERRLLCQR